MELMGKKDKEGMNVHMRQTSKEKHHPGKQQGGKKGCQTEKRRKTFFDSILSSNGVIISEHIW